jgi:hypothetical protein
MNRETRSIINCTLVGAIIGWVVGIVQVIYIGSWPLVYWAFMPLLPLYSMVGGGLYGMIFGGGGIMLQKSSEPETASETRSRSHAA